MNHDNPYSSSPKTHRSIIPAGLTRRELLARGAGAMGLLAFGGWRTLLLAGEAPPPAHRPNLAKNAPSLPVAIQRCESYEPALVRQRLDARITQRACQQGGQIIARPHFANSGKRMNDDRPHGRNHAGSVNSPVI